MSRVVQQALLIAMLLVIGACSSSPGTTTSSPSAPTSQPPPTPAQTSSVPDSTQPTPGVPSAYVPPSDFVVEIGTSGVTYELDGSPPSGPTSFVVLGTGSVAVADTMAAGRGEPRILLLDGLGDLISVIDLSGLGVASVVDLATDGTHIAVLDIDVSRDRYTVLTVDLNGDLQSTSEVPVGFRFEDGLTGIVWDDSGILLSFEFGARFARLSGSDGAVYDNPSWDGREVEALASAGKITKFQGESATIGVERDTDLGGATLLGLSLDGSVVVVLDEVELRDGAFFVRRTLQRYTTDGNLLAETEIDISTQVVDIQHPLVVAPDGSVIWMDSRNDGLYFVTLDV